MAGIQASGLGSGLDINSLVSQLVTAERAPLEQRIVRHETKVTTKISALGTLKGALSTFKSALVPSGTGGARLGSIPIFSTARSCAGLAPTSVAL